MSSLLILLILTFFLVVKGFRNNTEKNVELIKAVTLFALAFGLFGFILGLISALDTLDSMNTDIHPAVLSGGIKRSILSPTLGFLVFLTGRLGVIFLMLIKKKK